MSIGSAGDLSLTNRLVFKASVLSLLLLVGIVARAATIVVPASGNLQAALDAAQCGDTVVLEAGATFTVAGLEQPFQLKPKGACTGTDADWITVMGSNAAALPATLRPLSVQAIRALNLPKLVTNTSTPALEAVASAHHYRVIGIEITNDSQGGTLSNNGLIFAGIVHGSSPPLTLATVPRSIEFDRVWVHSEEDGTDSEIATCLRGFLLGAADITVKNSRVAGFRAFAPGTFNPQSSQAILIEKGPGPYTISNNFLEAWFTSIFTGGGPQWITNQATVSPGATMSQATLSNVNNLTVGDYIAFKVTGQGGVYQVVRVTGIDGNTVNYVPQPGLGGGTNGNPLLVPPDSPGHAVWNGDTPKDLRITNNTFWKNSVVGLAAGAHGFYGKGHIEFKTATNALVEGNDFSGFGAGFTITSRNQPTETISGSNPWATINNLTFRSNRWSSNSPAGTGAVIGIQLSDNMATCVPGRNVVFENNLFENLGSPLLTVGGSAGVVFRHNTAVGGGTAGEVSMVFGHGEANEGFRFEDNIVQNNQYGLNCSLGSTAACYPNHVVSSGVILDNRTQAERDIAGPLANRYPAGNFFPDTVAQIQFIDIPTSQWGLASTSPYKGRGTNGTDPGVDMNALLAALAGVAPPPTPTPTPPPTPTPTPTPTPQSGQSVIRAKRDGQDLSNQLASSGGTSQPDGSGTFQMSVASSEALTAFIVEIQNAYAQFNAERQVYPAAVRIDAALVAALQCARQAEVSSGQGDLDGVRNHLREAINYLELGVALISHGDIANPIDVPSYLVRQHYVDFLDREPEQAGNDFWVNHIANCGTDAQCVEVRRIHVSAAFFLSIEFQHTGYFVYRLYRSSYGRMPSRTEFMPDSLSVSRGVIVGTAGWEARLAASKQAFLQAWSQRAAFTARYGALTNEEYVDALIANLGVEISAAERDGLVTALASGSLRASVLGQLAENGMFSRNQFNSAFVLMQYFGYLRRDPDTPGFNFWLNKLNQFNGDYGRAEMVRAFLSSIEYRSRFAQ
ncbi:MAG: DUF4214 domain-containing protein [Pyrinomonadaceae bacterium]